MTDNQRRDGDRWSETDLSPIETLFWLQNVIASNHPHDWTDHDIALIEQRIKKAIAILGNDAAEKIKQAASRYSNRE